VPVLSPELLNKTLPWRDGSKHQEKESGKVRGDRQDNRQLGVLPHDPEKVADMFGGGSVFLYGPWDKEKAG